MKRFFTWALGLAVTVGMPLNAVGNSDPVLRQQKIITSGRYNAPDATVVRPQKVSGSHIKAQEDKIILSEKFDLFTAGSENQPDSKDICGNDGSISPTLTTVPGWTGGGIHQAGGICALRMYSYTNQSGNTVTESGYLTTPYIDLSDNDGTFRISFRARLLNSISDQLKVLLCSRSAAVAVQSAEIGSGWQQFTFDFTGGFLNARIQIYAELQEMLIDDLLITTADSGFGIPKVLPATDITDDGFTANWERVTGATQYLLDVFYYASTASGSQETTVTEGFDGINLLTTTSKRGMNIDDANSVYPEGWTIGVKKYGNVRHGYNTEGNYGAQAISLAFDAAGDSIVTPETDAPINTLSFWTKHTGMGENYISVCGKTEKGWVEISKVWVYLNTEGKTVTLSDEIPVGTTQIKLVYHQEEDNNGIAAIDDISYTYGGDIRELTYLLRDEPTVNNYYTVTGTDPNEIYYYTVQAYDGTTLTEESEICEVGAFTGTLTMPEGIQFSNVEDGKYTASWKRVPGASGYALYNYLMHYALKDEQYVVLHEGFEKITEGTFNEPIEAGSFLSYFDEFTENPDWSALFGCWANSMIGGAVIYTPKFELTNKSGFTAHLLIYGIAGDSLRVTNNFGEGEETFRLKLSQSGPNLLTFKFKECGQENSLNIWSSGEFFLDEISIWQDMKRNDRSIIARNYVILENKKTTQYTFTDLPSDDGDCFRFRMSAYATIIADNGTESVVRSPWTDRLVVSVPEGVEEIRSSKDVRIATSDGCITIQADKPVSLQIFRPDGQCILADDLTVGNRSIAVQPGIYIVRAGSAISKVLIR